MNTLQHNKKEQAKTCSIHKLNTMKKNKKIECSSLKSVMNTRNGGQGWIRTTEVVDGRFTVCSLWPLGNLPILTFQIQEELNILSPNELEYKNGAGGRTNPHFVRLLCSVTVASQQYRPRTSHLKTIHRIVFLTVLTLSGFESE